MLTIALLLIVRAQRNPKLIQYSSIPLFLAFLMRPTNAISCLVLTIFVAVKYSVFLHRFIAWAVIILGLFVAYSLSIYDSVLPPYYLPTRVGSMDHFSEALLGNLVSPSRGLLVFSPILLFSVLGLALKIKRKPSDKMEYYLVAILLLHWLAISTFAHWWAGWSIGPRFFSDMIPYLTYFLIFPLEAIPNWNRPGRIAVLVAMSTLCAVSFCIHYRGAVSEAVYRWNGIPSNIDQNPKRLWDWHDPQFLRGLNLY